MKTMTKQKWKEVVEYPRLFIIMLLVIFIWKENITKFKFHVNSSSYIEISASFF